MIEMVWMKSSIKWSCNCIYSTSLEIICLTKHLDRQTKSPHQVALADQQDRRAGTMSQVPVRVWASFIHHSYSITPSKSSDQSCNYVSNLSPEKRRMAEDLRKAYLMDLLFLSYSLVQMERESKESYISASRG